MNHRLMMLALMTALFAWAWSSDGRRSQSPFENARLAAQQRTPIAALMQRRRVTLAASGADSRASWSQRMGRHAGVWGGPGPAAQSSVWCSRPAATASADDYWRFGCGRFEDGSFGAAGDSTPLAVDIEMSRDLPFPCGMVPGTYAVVGQHGSIRKITVTEEALIEEGHVQRWPAGYYVHTDAQQSWHYFRIADELSRGRDLPQLAGERAQRLLWEIGRIAGRRWMGPAATLPLAAWSNGVRPLAAAATLGQTLDALRQRPLRSMTQEFQNSLRRIEWSQRFAGRRQEARN